MGRIGKLIKTQIEKFIIATVETRFKFNQTCDFYASSGDDAPPIKNDRIAVMGVDGTGNFVALGVLMKSQGAKPGERFIYSQNDKGELKAIIKLLGDGKIETLAPDEVKLTADKKIIITAKEDIKVTSDKQVNVKGSDVKIEGNIEVTGGTFKAKGTAAPTGTGCLCAIPVCPFTGAPHTGDTSSGN